MLDYAINARYEPGVYVLFLILLIIGMGLLITFLVFRVRKEQASFSEIYIDKGITSFDWLKKYIERTIAVASRKTAFYLYQLDINDHEPIKKTLGDNQYFNLQKEICGRLNKLLPWGIKVAIKKDESIVIYVKNMFNLDVEGLAKLIIDNTVKDLEIANTYNLELSVNVAVAGYPSGGDNADALVKNLDLAMVVSHRAGNNNFAFYTPQMGSKESDEYKYYQEIQDAIKEKEFTLFYQSIIDTNTLNVYAGESLIRWKHRTMGVLPPSNFLYVMEQTGDINWVGFWCFEQMIRQHLVWKSNYADNKLDISINLSEKQLLNAELADEMRKIARKQKANPQDYIFEIANFGLYFSSETAKSNINKLKEYGFKIALDNFGAEFNSPTTLDQLPIDIIKVESNFWRKSQRQGIAADVFGMVKQYCTQKNLMLITSGVETVEEMMFLRKTGVNYMQGYLFNAPCEPRDFVSGMVMLPWEDKIQARLKEINDELLAERRAIEEQKAQDEAKALEAKRAAEEKRMLAEEAKKAAAAELKKPPEAPEANTATETKVTTEAKATAEIKKQAAAKATPQTQPAVDVKKEAVAKTAPETKTQAGAKSSAATNSTAKPKA